MQNIIKRHSNEALLFFILIFIFIVMSILSPDKFLKFNNIQSMFYQMPEFGIMALGMMAIIVTGGINLSLTYGASLSGILAAMILAKIGVANPSLAIVLSILTCFLVSILVGSLNGFLVAYIGVVPMLATIGTMILFEGISLNFTKGGAISGFPEAFAFIGNEDILGIPVSFIIYAFAIILSYFLLERSAWGTELYMTGCNPVATRFSGVDTRKTLIMAYIYSALLSGLSALVMISRYNSAKVDYGSSYMMQSIAAVVLGGTSISGGSGTVFGTVVAVCIVSVLANGINILGINPYFVQISTGGILIVALILKFLSTKYNFSIFKTISDNK